MWIFTLLWKDLSVNPPHEPCWLLSVGGVLGLCPSHVSRQASQHTEQALHNSTTYMLAMTVPFYCHQQLSNEACMQGYKTLSSATLLQQPAAAAAA
jgi:hypothetical protein